MSKQDASLDASFWINLCAGEIADHYRLDEAITLYEKGEIDLRAAARHAGVSMYQRMTELQRREITPPETEEKFFSGLQTLAETFGGSPALHETIAQYRTSE